MEYNLDAAVHEVFQRYTLLQAWCNLANSRQFFKFQFTNETKKLIERQDRLELTTFNLRDNCFTPELVRHNFRQPYFDLERFINARLVAVSNVPNHA